MKKTIITLFALLALSGFAIEVPEGAVVEKEITTVTILPVNVDRIHHPLIMIRSNRDTGEVSMSIQRDKLLEDGTVVRIHKRFNQDQIITLLGGVLQFQQVFGTIEAGLQADVNAE